MKGKNNKNSFEISLFEALRSYGYIFPKSQEDVENFEDLYGTTAIEVPEFESLNRLNEELVNSLVPKFNSRMAAYSSKKKDKFNLGNEPSENNE